MQEDYQKYIIPDTLYTVISGLQAERFKCNCILLKTQGFSLILVSARWEGQKKKKKFQIGFPDTGKNHVPFLTHTHGNSTFRTLYTICNILCSCALTLLGTIILKTYTILSLFESGTVQLYSVHLYFVITGAYNLLGPVIALYRWSVHLCCRTCPLVLVLVLTNGSPSAYHPSTNHSTDS